MNVNRLNKKLKSRTIEEIMHHLRDMLDSFSMKFKERFVNNLDLVENMVRLCVKLSEKGFSFTNKLLYSTVYKNKGENNEGDHDFEVV